jgi:hypothetical protein
VRSNCTYCKKCKQVDHIERNYKHIPRVLMLCMISLLVHQCGLKEESHLGAKSLVTNFGGPKQVWVSKELISLCRLITRPEKDIDYLIVGALNI